MCDWEIFMWKWIQGSLFWLVSAGAGLVFVMFRLAFWAAHRGSGYFYFDPQDTYHENHDGRSLPLSAKTGTFDHVLKLYVGVTQLLITVAAASIAFGANSQSPGAALVGAKLLLAWSIIYGVLFCALLLWRYDEYSQDVTSYALGWYSTIVALAFSCLVCFMLGYLVWGWGLSTRL